MKRCLALMLSLVLMLGISTTALAASGGIVLTPMVPSTEKAIEFSLSVGPTSHKYAFNTGLPYLYTYGPKIAGATEETGGREARIQVIPQTLDKDGKTISDKYKISRMTARPDTKNVTASVKLNGGTLNAGKLAPVITLKAASGVRDTELADYKVTVDIRIGEISGTKIVNTQDITITLQGKESAAYAQGRDVESDESYLISENAGSVFHFDYDIDEKTRIRTGEGLDVYFTGNYGTDSENMRVVTDTIDAVEKKFSNNFTQYADFVGTPKFASKVTVRWDGPEDAYLYLYNKSSGAVSPVKATYKSSGYYEFDAKSLGCYFMTDKEFTGTSIK